MIYCLIILIHKPNKKKCVNIRFRFRFLFYLPIEYRVKTKYYF